MTAGLRRLLTAMGTAAALLGAAAAVRAAPAAPPTSGSRLSESAQLTEQREAQAKLKSEEAAVLAADRDASSQVSALRALVDQEKTFLAAQAAAQRQSAPAVQSVTGASGAPGRDDGGGGDD